MSGRHALAAWLILTPFLGALMEASGIGWVEGVLSGLMLAAGCFLLPRVDAPTTPPPIHDAEDTRDYNDLVVQQFRRIRQLQSALDEHKSAVDDVRNSMICIGGPLNDNKLGYTAEQRKPFHRIEQMIAGLGSEYDPRFDQ